MTDLSIGYVAHAIAFILDWIDDEHPEETPEAAAQAIVDNASDCQNQLPYAFGDTNPLIQLNIDEIVGAFDLAVRLMDLPDWVAHPALNDLVAKIRGGYIWRGARWKITTNPAIINRIRKFL